MASQASMDRPQVQAAFDFLPGEIRHALRFGSPRSAELADFRAQSRLVDRQVAGLVSRIAAARLREVLAPAETVTQVIPGNTNVYLGTPSSSGRGSSSIITLSEQRDILREIGTVLFRFRDDDEAPVATLPHSQRLHPRPLPARYYDAALLPPCADKAA